MCISSFPSTFDKYGMMHSHSICNTVHHYDTLEDQPFSEVSHAQSWCGLAISGTCCDLCALVFDPDGCFDALLQSELVDACDFQLFNALRFMWFVDVGPLKSSLIAYSHSIDERHCLADAMVWEWHDRTGAEKLAPACPSLEEILRLVDAWWPSLLRQEICQVCLSVFKCSMYVRKLKKHTCFCPMGQAPH